MDNKGLTLIELIIAIAISSIIIGVTIILIKTAQKDYQYTSDTADIQTETQVLMEQVGKWIMEGNRIKIGSGGKELIVYYIPADKAISNTKKRIIWGNSGKLYMKSFNNVNLNNDKLTYSASDEIEENLIGDYVDKFDAKFDGSTQSCVEIDMTLKHGSQRYNVENKVSVRNKIR